MLVGGPHSVGFQRGCSIVGIEAQHLLAGISSLAPHLTTSETREEMRIRSHCCGWQLARVSYLSCVLTQESGSRGLWLLTGR